MAELVTKDQVLTSEEKSFYDSLNAEGKVQRADIYAGTILRTRELEIEIRERQQKLLDLNELWERRPGHNPEVEEQKAEYKKEIYGLQKEYAQWSKYAKKVETGNYTGLEEKGLGGRIAERFGNANIIAKFFMVVLFPLVVLTEINFGGNKKSPKYAGAAEERGQVFRMQQDGEKQAGSIKELEAKTVQLEAELKTVNAAKQKAEHNLHQVGSLLEVMAQQQQEQELAAKKAKREGSVLVANQNDPQTSVSAKGEGKPVVAEERAK